MKSIVSSDHVYKYKSILGDPTLADLPVGTQQVFLNQNTGNLEHWGNNNGSIEKISGASAVGIDSLTN